MRPLRAPWLLLVVFATADAALTVADCSALAATRSPELVSDCRHLESLSANFARPIRTVLPNPGTLDSILGGLGHGEQTKSLWELFTGWLSDRFRELREALPDFPNPLQNLKWSWPDWLPDMFQWVGWVLLAALALAALVALLRALGVYSPAALQRAIDALRPDGSEASGSGPPTFADLEGAPVAERPRILLAVVLGALRAANRLAADAALTHRQLGPAVREVTPGQRAAIDSIASLAERVTYSRFVPNDMELTQAESASYELVGGVSR